MNQAQASQQLQQAITALQQGRAQEARSLFNSVVQQVPQAAQAWQGLAFSCSNLGDTEAAMAAIERCLKLEPRNIRALLFKAEHLDHAGQSRKALGFLKPLWVWQQIFRSRCQRIFKKVCSGHSN